jgi:hypothetical protein
MMANGVRIICNLCRRHHESRITNIDGLFDSRFVVLTIVMRRILLYSTSSLYRGTRRFRSASCIYSFVSLLFENLLCRYGVITSYTRIFKFASLSLSTTTTTTTCTVQVIIEPNYVPAGIDMSKLFPPCCRCFRLHRIIEPYYDASGGTGTGNIPSLLSVLSPSLYRI